MSIKINGVEVIDNSKNFKIEDISFIDGSIQISAGGGGGGTGSTQIYDAGELMHTLDNPNIHGISDRDYFGYSVDISGNIAVVGAYGEEDQTSVNSGKVYVYDVSTGELLRNLQNPIVYGNGLNDYFGYSVAISGNYCIVGAYGEDIAVNGYNGESGDAYIFDVTTGVCIHTLLNPNKNNGGYTNDYFGYAVAIHGNYCIVGAWGEDYDTTNTNVGIAYIFNVITGQLVHTLDNSLGDSTKASDYFGRAVAISDKYCVVGAPYDDTTGGASGQAYVFNIETGKYVSTLSNPNTSTPQSDYFATSVDIDGDIAIIGAPGANGTGNAYIFNVLTGTVVSTLDDDALLSQDNFGQSVSISNNVAIVGAYAADSGLLVNTGKAYLFDALTGEKLKTLEGNYLESNGRFGSSVSIDGNHCISGAWYANTNSGKAYIYATEKLYELNSIEKITFSNGFELSQDHPLLQKALVKSFKNLELVKTLLNPNEYTSINNYQDYFGGSIAISEKYIVVGSQEDGPNGEKESGKAYVYDANTGSYLRTINNPNPVNYDYFSSLIDSIDISEDICVIAANNSTTYGSAYAFDLSTGQFLHEFIIPSGFTDSAFGRNIVVGDKYCLVSDPYYSTYTGKIYVYNKFNGEFDKTISNPNSSTYDYFGYSMAMSGSYAVIGAYQEDIPVNGSGNAYIVHVPSGQFLYTLKNPNVSDIANIDYFGYRVAINGKYTAVGTIFETTDDIPYGTTSYSGAVYIFNTYTGELLHSLKNPNYIEGKQDYFGASIAIYGNYAVIGASRENDPNYTNFYDSGTVYVFNIATGNYVQKLHNPNELGIAGYDYFGSAVAINGDTIVAAATGDKASSTADDGSGGTVYIFKCKPESKLLIDKVLDLIPNS